jgi:Lon protease-like protein
MPHAHLPIVMLRDDFYSISSEVIESNIIAIMQPNPMLGNLRDVSATFKTGCAGKIMEVDFSGSDVAISVLGVCRFEVVRDFPPDIAGIERVQVSYEKFAVDMESQYDDADGVEKKRLVRALNGYFRSMDMLPSWPDMERIPLDALVSAITMTCPLHPSEKQSLMETVDIKSRSDLVTRIVEINALDSHNTSSTIN